MFRGMTPQIYMRQAVFQNGAGYLDIFGQLEAAFKTPAGDTAMKIICPLALGQGTHFHNQGVFFTVISILASLKPTTPW